MRRTQLALSGLILFFASQVFAGTTYPWQIVSRDSIFEMTDPDVQQIARLKLISKAKYTLDIITFDQRKDKGYGVDTLDAIREAADRGVKVRFLTAWVSSVFDEKWRSEVPTYLSQPPTATPIEYLIVGGWRMMASGFRPQDTHHDKILIRDGVEVLMAGGGHSSSYRSWYDDSRLIRGNLVGDLSQVFEDIWAFAKERHPSVLAPGFYQNFSFRRASSPALVSYDSSSESGEELDGGQGLRKPRKSISSLSRSHIKKTRKEISQEGLSDFSGLKSWLRTGRVQKLADGVRYDLAEVDSETALEARPIKVRVLHHHVLKDLKELCDKISSSPREFGTSQRCKCISDPVVQSVIEGIKRSQVREFRYAALALTINPGLKDVLIEQLKMGLKVKIFTNSRQSHSEVVPYPAAWYSSLKNIYDLQKAGAEIYVLKSPGQTKYTYVHQKAAIAGEQWVWKGSHNLLECSAHTGETSLQIEDETYAKESARKFDEALEAHGRLLGEEEVSQDMDWTFRWIKGPLFEMDFFKSLI